MLTLLPAGSTACGRGSQALGAARARRGVLPLLPGPWGSGLVSLPRCGPLGTAFLSPSCGARLAGFWLSTAPFLCCGHSGPTLGAEPGLLGRGPRGQRSFPLWLSSDFWLQFLASGNLLFRTSLRALRPVCLRPTWGLLCRPGRRRATTSGTRCSAVCCLCLSGPREATASQPRGGRASAPRMEFRGQASAQTRGAVGLLRNNPVFNIFRFFFGNQHSLERQGCENELVRFKYAGKTELYQGWAQDVFCSLCHARRCREGARRPL